MRYRRERQTGRGDIADFRLWIADSNTFFESAMRNSHFPNPAITSWAAQTCPSRGKIRFTENA